MVNHSTTGKISAATFHAALGVYFKDTVTERKGCDKVRRLSSTERTITEETETNNHQREVCGVYPAEPQVLLEIPKL